MSVSTLVDITLFFWVIIAVVVGGFRGLRCEAVKFVVAVAAIVGAVVTRGFSELLLMSLGKLNFLYAALLAFPASLILLFFVFTLVAALVMDRKTPAAPGFDSRIFGALIGLGRGLLSMTIIAAVLAAYPMPGDPLAESKIVGLAREWGLGRLKTLTGPLGETLPVLSEISGNPEKVTAFVSSPEIQSLVRSPQVQTLLADPEIQSILRSRNTRALFTHPKFDRLMKEKAFVDLLRSTDIEAAAKRARG